jgi:hypothetical protein
MTRATARVEELKKTTAAYGRAKSRKKDKEERKEEKDEPTTIQTQ